MFGLLVPASDVTWQVFTQPLFYRSQLTGIMHMPLLSLPSPVLLLHGIFTLIFTALTMAWKV